MEKRGKLFNVVENDRMYGKQTVVSAKLLKEEAIWIQSLRYHRKHSDPFMQYTIDSVITKRWGEDV